MIYSSDFWEFALIPIWVIALTIYAGSLPDDAIPNLAAAIIYGMFCGTIIQRFIAIPIAHLIAWVLRRINGIVLPK